MIDSIMAAYGPYLKPMQAAQCLNIKRDLMYGLLRSGAIKSRRVSISTGSIRIAVADLVTYMTPDE